MLDAAGWSGRRRGIRARAARSCPSTCRALGVAAEHPGGPARAEMTKPIGVDFKVEVVSVDKLTEITTREVKGKMAPDFDTFIWGWGGDPYDPGLLLNLLTTKAIGASSDAFYSNPSTTASTTSRPASSTSQAQGDRRPDDRARPARPAPTSC